MNRKIVAAAASVLLSAVPGAFAQSSVAIYGVADSGITRVSNIAGSGRTSLDSGIWQSSRIGFRGTEDLGGGSNALFVLEAGVNIDTGAGAAAGSFAFNRQSFVGLSGEWGTVTAGRQYDFVYVSTLPLGAELFAGGVVSGTAGGPRGSGGSSNVLDVHFGGTRYDNSIKWVKAFGPVSVGLMHGWGQEGAVGADTKSVNSALLSYRSGPLAVGLGWVKDDFNAANSGNSANRVAAVKALYRTGQFAFLANYANGASRNTQAQNKPVEVGVAYNPVPQLTMGIALAQAKARHASGARVELRQVTLGAIYNLSKRTALYAIAASNRSSNPAVYQGFVGVPGGATAPSSGATQSVTRLGVTHFF